jgi:hypothetical protein
MTEAAKAEDVTISGDWTFSGDNVYTGPGPTFTDGNAFTIDPGAGNDGDIRWETDGSLKALARWSSTGNILSIQDRDPSALTRFHFDIDQAQFRVYATGETTDYAMLTGSQLSFYEAAGAGLANIDTYVDGTSVGTTLRFHRNTNVDTTCDTSFFRGDGTTTAMLRIRYDNVAAKGELELLRNTHLRIYDDDNSEWFNIDQDAGGYTTIASDNAGTRILRFINYDQMYFQDGCKLYIFESNDSNAIILQKNAGAGYIDANIAADDLYIQTQYSGNDLYLGNSGGVIYTKGPVKSRGGQSFQAFDVDDAVHMAMKCENNSVSTGHMSSLDCSHANRFKMQAVAISDDATATFDIGSSYAQVFVVTSYNATTYAHLGFAGVNAPINYGSGSNVSVGATNPNVDTDVNIWPSSSGTMSIKNRMGSARSFYVFSMEP